MISIPEKGSFIIVLNYHDHGKCLLLDKSDIFESFSLLTVDTIIGRLHFHLFQVLIANIQIRRRLAVKYIIKQYIHLTHAHFYLSALLEYNHQVDKESVNL